MITEEQIKDLRQMKGSEMVIGGVFYKREGDQYHRCTITKQDIERNPEAVRRMTKEFSEKGLLYVRKSKPFEGFES